MNQLFASGSQWIGASASESAPSMNIQDWFPLGWTGFMSLQSKGFSKVFSNTKIQKHQFFGLRLIFLYKFIYFNCERWWLLLFSCSVMSDSLRAHGLQHTTLPCPSPSPGACSNSCPLSWWYHLTISSFVILSCLQSFPASWFFQWVDSLHQVAKILELELQHQSFQWIFKVFPSGLTGLISLQSKGFSKVFSNTTVRGGSQVKI